MPESKLPATASLSADFYPTPPTSPQSAKVVDRPALGRDLKSPNFEASIDLVASSTPSLRQKAQVRPVTQVESEASDEDGPQRENETSKLNDWKAALSLSEMKCGATKPDKQPCNMRISMKKKERIEDIIKLLWLPKNTPLATEAHLDTLTELVHCRHHDHKPLREARVDQWLEVLPGGPRSPSLRKRLRNILGSAPTECTFSASGEDPCGSALGEEQRFFCDKTIKEMIKMAIEPNHDNEPLAVLVAVLQYHMVCDEHNTPPYKHQDDWTRRISKFRAACENEINARNREKAMVQNNNKHKPKPSSAKESTLVSPPATPSPDQTFKDSSAYWNKGFETSRFHILGKGDVAGENATSEREIRKITQQLLSTVGDKRKNEVNNGYVYLYQVPGNDNLVKIGFTTRDVAKRHEEWKESCHREPTVLYPTAAAACKAVPHAHRLERLVHAELLEHQVRFYCERCEKQHIEWFEISVEEGIEVIEKWSRWMEGRPYAKRETREGVKWYLKETEGKRLADVSKFLQELQEAAKQPATS